MGALQDRLILTIQDVRAWLKLPLTYQNVTVEIVVDPVTGIVPASTLFYAIIDGQRAEFDSGVGPTPATVAAGLIAAIDALAITGVTTTDLGSGRFSIEITPTTSTFELYLSLYQVIEPTIPDDAILVAMTDAALVLADDYINNDFACLDDDGLVIAGTEEEIPSSVRVGVLQLIGWLLAEQAKSAIGAGTTSASPLGAIKSKKTGALTVTYQSGTDSATAFATQAAAINGLPIVVASILDAYRLMPGYRVARSPRPRPFGLGDMGPQSSILPTSFDNFNS